MDARNWSVCAEDRNRVDHQEPARNSGSFDAIRIYIQVSDSGGGVSGSGPTLRLMFHRVADDVDEHRVGLRHGKKVEIAFVIAFVFPAVAEMVVVAGQH